MSVHDPRIEALHRRLGIAADYATRTGLPPQPEADTLVTVVTAAGDRPQRLVPEAAARWARMEAAAERDAVRLLLVSAFRSVDHQAGLIERKLARGLSLEEILRVNAAPGYSEHHSGRAVDIGTPDQEPLIEAFEDTEAFAWLRQHAHEFGFVLSYPRDNPFGIAYEPWHWALAPDPE
ncbi:MAG: M15 family metallopeptidase [Halofilum sp. (in: g-proteobacteria)]|nr:M15 family metallopeptidase [Halofilum sp. (in: g-proteobacteria)]